VNGAILTLNAGSSSLKFALFRSAKDGLALIAKGQIESIPAAPHLLARDEDGTLLTERRWPAGRDWRHEDFLGGLLDWIEDHLEGEKLIAAGHRVVHGGAEFAAPVRIDETVLTRLDRLCPLAPLHQPHNLAAVRAVRAVRPSLPQIACFDTAFHHGQPKLAKEFALPRALSAEGVRRYGFHGLSYEYVAGRLRQLAPALAAKKVIVAHLGNGASLCAIADGRSIDTTMGFTALDGLMMGTRCGAIDPGVLLYLLQQRGMRPAEIEDLLYHRSGLLGVSGESGDMRTLLDSDSPAAREAVALFLYRVGREMGALTASLGGLDGVVFTAGIGENAPAVRQGVAERLAWLGARLDSSRNHAGEGRISSDDSAVEIWVIPTDEEAMIARHSFSLVTA
jgi:acetate kinase